MAPTSRLLTKIESLDDVKDNLTRTQSILETRNISPRLKKHLLHLIDKHERYIKHGGDSDYHRLLNGIRRANDTAISCLEKLDDIQNRDSLSADEKSKQLREFIWRTHYGDYFQWATSEMKQDPRVGVYWENVNNWASVAAEIAVQKDRLKEWEKGTNGGRKAAKPHTHLLDDLTSTAGELGLQYNDVVGRVRLYAERNSKVHSGIKMALDDCRYDEVSRIMARDLRELHQKCPDDDDDVI